MSSKWVSSSPPAAAGGWGWGVVPLRTLFFFCTDRVLFFRGVETSRSSLALVYNRICRSKMLCLLFCFGERLGFIGRFNISEKSQHNGKQYRHVDQACGLASHRSRFQVTIPLVRNLSAEERMASGRRFHLPGVSPHALPE